MGLKPLQINLLQVSLLLLQFLPFHRPLRCKIFNLAIHLEMVTMRLSGFNPLQIPTPFNHRLLRSNLGKVVMSHRPLHNKMINSCTVVIHLKMITMRLKGLNSLNPLPLYPLYPLYLLCLLCPLQIPTSFAHRLLQGKASRIGVGVIIYVEEMRRLLTIYHHQFTLRSKINWSM